MNSTREIQLRTRIRWLTWLMIGGLVVSGATAIPLETELSVLAHLLGVASDSDVSKDSGLAGWIHRVWAGLRDTNAHYPFMAYGFDWLAFGHFVIAIAFIGALRDPVRNVWLFEFGMIACALVIPYAFIMGGVRGIPLYWRLIDCSFGVFGFIPLWYSRHYVRELETLSADKNPT